MNLKHLLHDGLSTDASPMFWWASVDFPSNMASWTLQVSADFICILYYR